MTPHFDEQVHIDAALVCDLARELYLPAVHQKHSHYRNALMQVRDVCDELNAILHHGVGGPMTRTVWHLNGLCAWLQQHRPEGVATPETLSRMAVLADRLTARIDR